MRDKLGRVLFLLLAVVALVGAARRRDRLRRRRLQVRGRQGAGHRSRPGGRHRRRAGGSERRRRAGRQGRDHRARRPLGRLGRPARRLSARVSLGRRAGHRRRPGVAAPALGRGHARAALREHAVPDQGERGDRPAGRRPPRRRPGDPGHAQGRRDGVRARGADLASVQLDPVVHGQSVGRGARLHRAGDRVHGPRLAALARLEPPSALHDAPRPAVHRPRRRAAVPAGRLRLAVLRGLVRGDGAVGGLRRLVPARSPRCRCCSSRRGSSSPASSSS